MKANVVFVKDKEMPCEDEVFTINGKDADVLDFGLNIDTEKKVEGACCANHKFARHLYEDEEIIQEKLNYYGIDADDYNEICEMLARELNVGKCNICAERNKPTE